MNLFSKVAAFTDIHFGEKNNSKSHNQDCENFIDWFISKAKEEEVDCVIFLGDWHESRKTLNVQTMNYSIRCLEKLNDAFDKIYFITGNHDLYYREKRDVHSIVVAKNLKNIILIDEIKEIDNVLFVPWLVGNEHEEVSKYNSKYVFGHFEIGGFLRNNHNVAPPGKISLSDFKNFELVFSGHFHKRQVEDNFIYMGNTFPIDYNDEGDTDRGMMIMEWGDEPYFLSWEEQPKYKYANLSDIKENPENFLDEYTNIKIKNDLHMPIEEVDLLRQKYYEEFNCRAISFTPVKIKENEKKLEELELLPTGQMVHQAIDALDLGKDIDKELLKELYDLLEQEA